MTSNNGRRYTWNGENQPVGMVGGDWVPEAYAYDAEGTRVLRTREGSATAYVGGLYEQDLRTGTERLQYEFAGEVIAQRTVTGGWGPLHYLHGDHLGSVAVATAENGAVVSRQAFTPWGEVRSGGVGQTTRNFTGQKKDGTGLLFYNARYYDPGLGRFLSADSIVPERGTRFTPLTVDFHEPHFTTVLAQENRQLLEEGFFQTEPSPGDVNPQLLNRYSYVRNNPLRYTDPTGHLDADEVIKDGGGVGGGGAGPRGGGSSGSSGGAGGGGPISGENDRDADVPKSSPPNGKAGKGGNGQGTNGSPKLGGNRFDLQGQLKQIWGNARLFKNWVHSQQSIWRAKPLTHAEARQLIANARRHGIPVDLYPRGLQGLEEKGSFANIPHFKIGHTHVTVDPGFVP